MDWLSVEEPLQILVAQEGRPDQPLTTTLRTPGDDLDLGFGLLRSEGVLHGIEQVLDARHCGPAVAPHASRNILKLTLSPEVELEQAQLARFALASASCGLCGKTALDALYTQHDYRPAAGVVISAAMLTSLPERLRTRQAQFQRSGGLHAAAVFDTGGALHSCREDIGRHNAVDKVLGDLWRRGQPTDHHLLLLSGRGGFELIQKAVTANLPIVAAMGAPSSLAVELARSLNMTLIGFLNAERFNIYSGEHRITD